MNEKANYLGEERIATLMRRLSVPSVLSLLVGALYNIVDQIFIGNSELSALGNAAAGIVFPVFIITQAFAWCYGDGCAAYLNISQGKNDEENPHKAIGTGLIVTVATSIVLMAIIFACKESILTVFGASENSLGMAVEYLNVILVFFPVNMLANMMNAVVRADGSPKWAMASMVSGAVTNIVLDPVFIFGLKWGMFGAALATVIGQTVSFLLCFVYFFRTKTFKLRRTSFIPDFRVFSHALKLGASSFITQMTLVTMILVCNVMLVKYGRLSVYGADVPIAIMGIESKVFTVVINLTVGIALGCQPIISYNMGARKFDRVKQVHKYILICTIVISGMATLLFQLAPRGIVGLFGVPANIPNPEAYWIFGEKIFRIFHALVILTCLIKVTSLFFQAVGKPVHAVISSLIRDIVCFIPLILILSRLFGIEGILYATPCADLIAGVVVVLLTSNFVKSLEKTKKETETKARIKQSEKGVIITIAREHGSSGKQIGKLVAEKMNIPFYYKEMTALAAQESGLDKEFISDLNKDSPSRLRSLYLSTDVVQQAVIAQSKVIREIADSGSCVIVGRAADYVLRHEENVVKVFIYAPPEYRIKRVMEVYGDTPEEAKRNIDRSDAARASYYKEISDQSWGKYDNYDLLIDSSIGLEETAKIIHAYVLDKQKTNNRR